MESNTVVDGKIIKLLCVPSVISIEDYHRQVNAWHFICDCFSVCAYSFAMSTTNAEANTLFETLNSAF